MTANPNAKGGNPTLSLETAKERVALVQAVHDATGLTIGGRPSLIMEAARRHNMSDGTLRSSLRAAKRLYGLEIIERAPPPEPEEQPDPVIVRTLRDDSSRLRRELDAAHRELNEARAFRANILNLSAEPIEPADVPWPKRSGKAQAEAAVLHLSDLHWGEVISKDELGGLNSFSSEIAAKRLARCFSAFIDLITKHWTGPAPCRVIVILGGDLFSGDIHEELVKTNDNPMPLVVKDLLGNLVACLNVLADAVKCPIDVYSVDGNHGRLTRKPEAKRHALTNYDSLVADLLEGHFKVVQNSRRFNFYRPDSGDAVFKVFDWQLLVTHGDRIGSRGGQGFIGPAATIARGMKKIVDEYAASRVFIDWIFVGHFHTALRLEHGYANGCLCGPSEYSAKTLRARPAPATQNFFVIHPERGITQHREIQVGAPDEGSLYRKAA